MIANALNLYLFAIKQKALGDIELDCANAESCFITIDDFAGLRYRGHHRVEIWVLQVPEPGLIDLHGHFIGGPALAGFEPDWPSPKRRQSTPYPLTICINRKQLRIDVNGRAASGVVLERET